MTNNIINSKATNLPDFLDSEANIKDNDKIDMCINDVPIKNKLILDLSDMVIRCLKNNKITFIDPNILQGAIRWTYGDKREDLHNIYKPIIKSTKWYKSDNPDILNIFILFLGAIAHSLMLLQFTQTAPVLNEFGIDFRNIFQ